MFTYARKSLIILFLTLILTPCDNTSHHSAPAFIGIISFNTGYRSVYKKRSNEQWYPNPWKFKSIQIPFKQATEISTAVAVPICHFKNEKETKPS